MDQAKQYEADKTMEWTKALEIVPIKMEENSLYHDKWHNYME